MKTSNKHPHVTRREGFAGQRLFVLPASLLSQALRHPLLKTIFLTAAGHYPKAPGHLVERFRGVAEVILIVCVSGRGWIQFGRDRQIEINANDVVVIPQGTPHAYGADEQAPWSIMWAHFRGSNQNDFLRLLSVTTKNPILTIPPGELDRLYFNELYLAFESGCTLPNLMSTSARLRLILIDLARLQKTGSQRKGLTSQAIQKNIDWMRLHRHQKVGLVQLAEQAGLSVPHYSACFRNQMGYSPVSYFQRLKIQHAAQLLAMTDLSVNKIARDLGLDDPFYFSRLFKKVMGLSPRNFRTNKKQ